jgi:hypothetical protein
MCIVLVLCMHVLMCAHGRFFSMSHAARHVCMYVCVHVHMHGSIYAYMHTHTLVYIYIYNISFISFVRIYLCIYSYTFIYIYLCIYIHTYIHIHIDTYIHIQIYTAAKTQNPEYSLHPSFCLSFPYFIYNFHSSSFISILHL